MDRLQQLQRLQQLERLQQLGRLQQTEATNLDYTEFSGVEHAILYLDPPYQNTELDGYSIKYFDNQSFYDWAYEMSKKNIVLISSYEISDERFKCVYEFKNAKSTLAPNGVGNKTEKLFMVKKGKNNGNSNFTCSNGHDGLICVLSVSCSQLLRISTYFGFYLLLNRRAL